MQGKEEKKRKKMLEGARAQMHGFSSVAHNYLLEKQVVFLEGGVGCRC